MGADLIGYQALIPCKFTKEEKQILNKHLDDFESILKQPDFAINLVKEEGKCTLTEKINDLSPLLASEIDDSFGGYQDNPDELTGLASEYLEIISDARKFLEVLDFGGRDTSYRTYTILGRKYYSIFAGEMSWGDEPEGAGYSRLKDLDKAGLLHRIEELTIPSESPAEHFIKNIKD